MEALENILSRRSIRRFTDQPVDQAMLHELLKAGMAAPSAGNQQPWHFVIIDDRQILNDIPTFHPFSLMLKEAAAAILVCGDKRLEKYEGYWMIDCSAATENILLAAHALGLGAVWLGIYPREDRVKGIRQLIHLPEPVTPLSLIAIGYPAERKPPADRYDAKKIHHNRW